MKTFQQYIQEEEEGNQPKMISVFLGRMQPFHNGHLQALKMMKYQPMILLVKGKGTSEDKKKNPFSEDYQQKLIKKAFPEALIRVVNNANLKPILYHLQKTGEYKVGEIVAGDDRISSYERQISKDNPDVVFTESPRVTSATKVREAIKNDDYETFKKLVPSSLHSEWKKMKDTIFEK